MNTFLLIATLAILGFLCFSGPDGFNWPQVSLLSSLVAHLWIVSAFSETSHVAQPFAGIVSGF